MREVARQERFENPLMLGKASDVAKRLASVRNPQAPYEIIWEAFADTPYGPEFRFVLIAVAGWMNQHQLQIIDYLREENRVLRKQLGGRRVRFNDDQRRRLAAKAKGLGRRLLAEVATIVTPETLLAWHRKLIANKYDGTAQRGPGH